MSSRTPRGLSSGRETKSGRSELTSKSGNGEFEFRGDLGNSHAAKETNSVSDWCRTVLLNCLSVLSDGFAP